MSTRRLRTSSNSDDFFFKRLFAAFGAWIVFCAVVGLATLGVFIWAIILLVQHVTG